MQVQKILTDNPEMQRDFLQNEQGKGTSKRKFQIGTNDTYNGRGFGE